MSLSIAAHASWPLSGNSWLGEQVRAHLSSLAGEPPRDDASRRAAQANVIDVEAELVDPARDAAQREAELAACTQRSVVAVTYTPRRGPAAPQLVYTPFSPGGLLDVFA